MRYWLAWVNIDTGEEGDDPDAWFESRDLADRCAMFCNSMTEGNRKHWWVVPLL